LKRKLLVAKGTFEAMRGAERDLIRNLPALNKVFDVTMATIQPSPELIECAHENNFNILYLKEKSWQSAHGAFSKIRNTDLKSSTKAWKSIEGIEQAISESDAIHMVSGDGSFGLISLIPLDKPVHLHMLEPHRGLYEDVLHLRANGQPKRRMSITTKLLNKARKDDQKVIRNLLSRMNTALSGNSSYSASRSREIYDCEAGILHPSVDMDEFSPVMAPEEDQAWQNLKPRPEQPFVTMVGGCGWVKGAWETIGMLGGTGIGLAIVGGGGDIESWMIEELAEKMEVELYLLSRLNKHEMNAILRRSLAVVSLAHGEPFGLTPIEAFAIGTPALFVDEGGFRDTVIDGVNGRLLPRDDEWAWKEAFEQAASPENRQKWTEAGRSRIEELALTPTAHASRISQIFDELIAR